MVVELSCVYYLFSLYHELQTCVDISLEFSPDMVLSRVEC